MSGARGADASTPALGDWPPDDLETLGCCPLCGSGRRTVLYCGLIDLAFRSAPGRWTFHRCGACRAAYLDPRPTRATISRAYAGYYTHGTSGPSLPEPIAGSRWLRGLRNGYLNAVYGYRLAPSIPLGALLVPLFPVHRRRVDRWIRHLRRPAGRATLLDVGCGSGAFLLQARALGWEVKGLDFDPEAVSAARSAGLDVSQGQLEDESFPAGSFDAITLNHVLEHFHDPVAALRVCRGLLRPGGHVWIATPNVDSLGRRRYGRHWRGLEPPRHLVLFGVRALRDACARAGFGDVCVRADVGPYGMSAASRALAASAGEPTGFERGARAMDALQDVAAVLHPAWGEELVAIARR